MLLCLDGAWFVAPVSTQTCPICLFVQLQHGKFTEYEVYFYVPFSPCPLQVALHLFHVDDDVPIELAKYSNRMTFGGRRCDM